MSLKSIADILVELELVKNRHRYPENWEEISLAVRRAANWSCQTCGKKCRRSAESVEEFLARSPELPVAEVRVHLIRWCLTVAHLNHIESDCRSENLKAMCAPCHLKYDAAHHAQSRVTNRMNRLEENGQLNLFVGTMAE